MIVTKEIREALKEHLKGQRKPELVNSYLFYLEQVHRLNPIPESGDEDNPEGNIPVFPVGDLGKPAGQVFETIPDQRILEKA